MRLIHSTGHYIARLVFYLGLFTVHLTMFSR